MIVLLIILVASCGYSDKGVRVEYDDKPVVAYTFEEIKATCGKCHPGSAPAIPLNDEASFKASPKVLAEIESGDMPPTPGAFEKAKAIAFMKGTK